LPRLKRESRLTLFRLPLEVLTTRGYRGAVSSVPGSPTIAQRIVRGPQAHLPSREAHPLRTPREALISPFVWFRSVPRGPYLSDLHEGSLSATAGTTGFGLAPLPKCPPSRAVILASALSAAGIRRVPPAWIRASLHGDPGVASRKARVLPHVWISLSCCSRFKKPPRPPCDQLLSLVDSAGRCETAFCKKRPVLGNDGRQQGP